MTDEPRKEDWQAALDELENYERRRADRIAAGLTPLPVKKAETPATPTPKITTTPKPVANTPKPVATETPAEGMSRYEELCRKPSMTIEVGDLKVMDEFSDVIFSVNTAVRLLDQYREQHPDVMWEERGKSCMHNLKETAMVMLREFHALRHGRAKKVYDKRNVCTVCHSVFMAPLPGGVCDECRSRAEKPRLSGEY